MGEMIKETQKHDGVLFSFKKKRKEKERNLAILHKTNVPTRRLC